MKTLLNDYDKKLINTLVIVFGIFYYIYLYFISNNNLKNIIFISISYTFIFYITLYISYSMGKFFTFYKINN